VFYFGDFDPAGWNMPIAVARKLQAHRHLRISELEVQVHRVALTRQQVLEHDLPSTPLKDTERHADRWRPEMGREQTEIDALAALRPHVLAKIARGAVRPFFDATLYDRFFQATMLPVDTQAWFRALPEYAPATQEITSQHKLALTAIGKLNKTAKQQAHALRKTTRRAADAPKLSDVEIKPEISKLAPAPQFSTADSLAIASRKLKMAKSLGDITNSEEADDESDDEDGAESEP
jgi:hypothetical protein